MKRQKVLLFAAITALACAALLGGCKAGFDPETGFALEAAFDAKDLREAERIVVSSAETGEQLALYSGADEVEAFLDRLDGERWKIAEMPEDVQPELVIGMFQNETLKAGMKAENLQEVNVCTIYTYGNSNLLAMEFPFARFTFSVSDGAAGFLRGFVESL